MKRLTTIPSSLGFANFVCSWESLSLVVEFLFGGGYFPVEMLRKSRKGWYDRLNGHFAEINHDCEYAINGLPNTALERNKRSGRYSLNVPR